MSAVAVGQTAASKLLIALVLAAGGVNSACRSSAAHIDTQTLKGGRLITQHVQHEVYITEPIEVHAQDGATQVLFRTIEIDGKRAKSIVKAEVLAWLDANDNGALDQGERSETRHWSPGSPAEYVLFDPVLVPRGDHGTSRMTLTAQVGSLLYVDKLSVSYRKGLWTPW